ncbi:4-hydroxybenzoyl-CoA thioesterase [Caenispirillum salinarum AK4]|uniref:4-hydroxybenzoyl-CoA thioesterase n=1 Tax=Caenispirillum salinarum AK4 TaxID=1238182 RepID=K9HSQ1_9PROT|nr:YbgC/FadM family acyl-CoA thioesterase [Caenispirillum salinarum]EKV31356.1 4-hydroxybenzoyl-CoA thioesterase [Caenispirillum salinarum AK4]
MDTVSRALENAASGAFRDGEHVFPVRVYFEDTDAGRIVYHARYLHFAERARSEMMRLCGWTNPQLMDDPGLAFAVRRATMDFRKPAMLDDLLEVRTRVTRVGGASLQAEQRVERDGETLVTIDITLASMAMGGGVCRLPAGLRARLDELVIRG